MTVASPTVQVVLGGAVVHLLDHEDAVTMVRERLGRTTGAGLLPPLAVASANIDHIHHFGAGGRGGLDFSSAVTTPNWLVLLDGVPLKRHAARLTGRSWPLLAGSDLLPTMLAAAEAAGATVGFLGGTAESHEVL